VLAVPESAVIDEGTRQLVYRQTSSGRFEGVQVVLGPRMLDPEGVPYFPLLEGVKRGDKIVTAGSFLVDAETRLNPAAGSTYFGGTGLNRPGAPAATTVRPSTPEQKTKKAGASEKSESGKDAQKIDAGLAQKIDANLAQLKDDRAAAEAQGYCPINQGQRLGAMGVPHKLTINGKPVFLC
jgi:hypothetical protein